MLSGASQELCQKCLRLPNRGSSTKSPSHTAHDLVRAESKADQNTEQRELLPKASQHASTSNGPYRFRRAWNTAEDSIQSEGSVFRIARQARDTIRQDILLAWQVAKTASEPKILQQFHQL